MPLYKTIRLQPQPLNHLRATFPDVSAHGIDLLSRLLTYDPARRITARSALKHPYFAEHPHPKKPEDFASFPTSHERAAGAGAGADAHPRAMNVAQKQLARVQHARLVQAQGSGPGGYRGSGRDDGRPLGLEAHHRGPAKRRKQ